MSFPPQRLDYEQPDEDRAAGRVSPIAQAAFGVGTFALLAVIAFLIYRFSHAPVLAVLNALALGAGVSLWAHYRLHWNEFVPAMAVSLALALMVIPLLGLLLWLFS